MLNKLLTKLQQKYSSNPLFQKKGILAPADEHEQKTQIKLPLFRLIFSPFNQILDNAKIFFILTLPAALLICMTSTLMGFNYLCTYSAGQTETLFCSNSLGGYLLHSIIKMLVWGYVAIKWCEYIYKKNSFSLNSLYHVNKSWLKISGCLFMFLLLNMLPLISWWILYVRTPNPDWRIEMVVFAIISIGFIMPLILLRFYVLLGFLMRGEKVPPLTEVWQKTSGNTLRIFAGFIFILMLAMFIFGNLYTNFKSLANNITMYNLWVSEYIYSFFSLFIFISFLNNINLQYEVIYASEKEENNAGN